MSRNNRMGMPKVEKDGKCRLTIRLPRTTTEALLAVAEMQFRSVTAQVEYYVSKGLLAEEEQVP